VTIEAKGFCRPGTPADASAIARVHIASWQWAYRGLIPDDYLDDLSSPANVERRLAMWQSILADHRLGRRVWVAVLADEIVGFCHVGPSGVPDFPPKTGEVLSLYLDHNAAGQGIGRELFARAVGDLRQMEYQGAVLWVLEGNTRASRFYAAADWQPDGQIKVEQFAGVTVREVRYSIQFANDGSPR
jgi:ribosomal protein S18 acetylase RimI-like enzyme